MYFQSLVTSSCQLTWKNSMLNNMIDFFMTYTCPWVGFYSLDHLPCLSVLYNVGQAWIITFSFKPTQVTMYSQKTVVWVMGEVRLNHFYFARSFSTFWVSVELAFLYWKSVNMVEHYLLPFMLYNCKLSYLLMLWFRVGTMTSHNNAIATGDSNLYEALCFMEFGPSLYKVLGLRRHIKLWSLHLCFPKLFSQPWFRLHIFAFMKILINLVPRWDKRVKCWSLVFVFSQTL